MANFHLPNLPYPYEALADWIDAETMRTHHQKHHQAYVNKLNQAIEQSPLQGTPQAKELTSLLQDKAVLEASPAIRNHGGGHYNHSLFFETITPQQGQEPTGKLAEALGKAFHNLANCRQVFEQQANDLFGSGWTWLYLSSDGLHIGTTSNQDNPLMPLGHAQQGIPIMGLDLWEHAYYLTYKNRRADYIARFWEHINWQEVHKRYQAAVLQVT